MWLRAFYAMAVGCTCTLIVVRQRTLARESHIMDMLAATTAILDARGIVYIADSGTLLGAVRDGRAIPGDSDGDLIIIGNKTVFARAAAVLARDLPQFHLQLEVWDKDTGAVDSTYTLPLAPRAAWNNNLEVCARGTSVIPPECHNPDIDIYPATIENGWFRRVDCGKVCPPCCAVPAAAIWPIEHTIMSAHGRIFEIAIPADPLALLNQYYDTLTLDRIAIARGLYIDI